MDVNAVWNAIRTWPAADREKLATRIWDELEDDESGLEVSEELKAEIRRREAANANGGKVYTRDEVNAYLDGLQ